MNVRAMTNRVRKLRAGMGEQGCPGPPTLIVTAGAPADVQGAARCKLCRGVHALEVIELVTASRDVEGKRWPAADR